MSFSGRLFLAFVMVILIPMIAFTLVVRSEVGDRLTAAGYKFEPGVGLAAAQTILTT